MANIFFEEHKKLTLVEYMNYGVEGRGNLGEELPVFVYRMMEYSLKEQLAEQFGKEMQVSIFRDAGFRAGDYFARYVLDTSLNLSQFIASLQKKMEELKIGVLRIEKYDEETGNITLTVSEDADCSGLPPMGETVCNYDEGFIAGILTAYTGRKYKAVETDCWASGDRVCRFIAEPEK